MADAWHLRRVALVQQQHARHAVAVLPENGYRCVRLGLDRHRLHRNAIKRGNPTDSNAKDLVSQGASRFSCHADLFVWQLVRSGSNRVRHGNKDQSVAQPNVVDIDDLWIRAGQWKTWDVQLGRFEAFEVYHFGMGMDLNTLERLGAAGSSTRSPPDVFELGGNSNIVYRQSGITNLAAHFYPTDFLRLEMLGQFGFDTASGIDTMGLRPAAVFDLGWMKLKGALDVRKQFSGGELIEGATHSAGW